MARRRAGASCSDVELEPKLTPEEQADKEEEEAREQMVEAQKDWAAFYEAGGVITPAMLTLIQRRRAIALREMNGETTAAATPDGSVRRRRRKVLQFVPKFRASTARPAPRSRLGGEARRREAALSADSVREFAPV